jgi:phospholipase/carboxylesterase
VSELLPCIEVEPRLPCRASVVWLHGLGASGSDFEPVAQMLGFPDVRFLFPDAPVRAVTVNRGLRMRAWYDIRSFSRDRSREDADGIVASAALVTRLLDREVARGVPAGRTALGGFSQGAAMALYVGHRYPARLAGILSLSGYLVLPDTLAEGHAANARTPLFFGHGTQDDVVPMVGGRAAYAALAVGGRDVTWKDYPIGHSVSPAEIADVGRWLRSTAGL